MKVFLPFQSIVHEEIQAKELAKKMEAGGVPDKLTF
jgi:hypothetical protein